MPRERLIRTAEQVQAAMATLIERGNNVKATARELGIPRSTLRLWRSKANLSFPILTVPSNVTIVADYGALWASAEQTAIARMMALIPQETDLRAVAYAASIAADRHMDYSARSLSPGRKGSTVQIGGENSPVLVKLDM